MLKSFFLSKQYGPYAWLMGLVICTISWYSVELSVTLNQWNREIYDTLQQLNEPRFWDLLIGWDWNTLHSFVTLEKNVITDKPIVPSLVQYIVFFIPIAVYFTWQTQRFLFKWRQANTEYYLMRWENCPTEIEGASQRIQEDCNRWASVSKRTYRSSVKLSKVYSLTL